MSVDKNKDPALEAFYARMSKREAEEPTPTDEPVEALENTAPPAGEPAPPETAPPVTGYVK